MRKVLKAVSKSSSKTREIPSIFLPSNYCTIHKRLAKGSTICCRNMMLAFRSIIMQLLSRVTSSHLLAILGFYKYNFKYLTHHQLRAPAILASLAQSSHDLTPTDALIPPVRKLSHQFVHPGVGSEVAAGLNAIGYRKSRDKRVHAKTSGAGKDGKYGDGPKQTAYSVWIFPPWTLTALRPSRIISRRYIGNTTSKTRLPDNDSPSPVEVNGTSALATTKILTPADFAVISDLRIQAATQAVEYGGGPAAKHKLASLSAVKKAAWSCADDTSALVVSESNILGPRKKAKADYEGRIDSARSRG
ncbi:hypothetical protein BGW80DRAFT_85365 [Lactifluus volemus]|nr:hypothetical protein BGW80DRAFT_85365 [Lactifluus volemus]